MKREAAVVVAAFLFAYILPLGYRPLSAPDELRYAEVPREMLAGGDWIVPHLDGVRYFEKPAGGYWLVASSMLVFGENAWAVRFPAALATAMAAFVAYRLVRSVTGCRGAGLIAALLHVTCIEVFIIGTTNLLDATFTGFVTAAIGTFWFAWRQPARTRRLWLMIGFGALCGCAVLVKGFLGVVIPAVVIAPFLAWQRCWRDLLTMPWIPLVAAIAVVAPWAIAIGVREPDFWRYFFWEEHIQRFVGGGLAQHPEPWWYFGIVIVGGALPWTVCWPAVVVGLRRAGLSQPILPYCVCWLVGPLLLFSASSGKLEPYVLPCFPPLAMLTAIGLIEHARSTGCRRRPFDYAIAGLIVAVLLVVVVDTQLDVIGTFFFGPGQQWRLLLLAGGLAMSLGLVLAAISATTPNRRVLLSVLATVGIFAAGHFLVPLKLAKPSQFPVAMIRANADLVDEHTLLVADPYLVHAVAWVFKRDDVHLLTDAGELAYGLQADETQTRGPHVEPRDIRRLLDDVLPERRVVVFTRHRTILAATEPADTRGAEGLWILEFE